MIIYCFIRLSAAKHQYAVATFNRPAAVSYTTSELEADHVSVGELAAMQVINFKDRCPEHVLFITEGDKWIVEREMDSFLDSYGINKYALGFTIAVEKYPDDFTPGSAASKIVERMIANLEERPF